MPGYLPETMFNYLLRLGWGAWRRAEILDKVRSSSSCSTLEGVGKSPGRMDYKKLDNLNGHLAARTRTTID